MWRGAPQVCAGILHLDAARLSNTRLIYFHLRPVALLLLRPDHKCRCENAVFSLSRLPGYIYWTVD